MKSMQAFKERCIAEVRTSVALELLKLGQPAFEDIATVCHMSLEQVQALADSLHH